jgi:hypothetical protein
MFPGINPALIGHMAKAQLDDILNGNPPDFLLIKEKTQGKIVLGLSGDMAAEGVQLKSLSACIVYRDTEIHLVHHGSEKDI